MSFEPTQFQTSIQKQNLKQGAIFAFTEFFVRVPKTRDIEIIKVCKVKNGTLVYQKYIVSRSLDAKFSFIIKKQNVFIYYYKNASVTL